MLQEKWVEALRTFNNRNMSRFMDVDILTTELGAQSEITGMTLSGVAFDHHDDKIEIMLGGKSAGHITHSIGSVTSVDVLSETLPSMDVLRIRHEGGQTILRANARAMMEPAAACELVVP